MSGFERSRGHICQQETSDCILIKEPNTVNQRGQVTFPFYLKTAACSQFCINEKPGNEAAIN